MNILVVEDDPLIALGLCQLIEQEFCAVPVTAGTKTKALRTLDRVHIDLAVLDVNLREETSYEVARRLKADRIPVIFTSGSRPEDLPTDLTDILFLRKPSSTVEMVRAIGRHLVRHPTDQELG